MVAATVFYFPSLGAGNVGKLRSCGGGYTVELVNAFFVFLSEAPVLVGSINLLTSLSFGKEVTCSIVKTFRKKPSPDELFWSLFLGSCFHTLRTVIANRGHISRITKKLEGKKLKKHITLSSDDLTLLFECVPRQQEEMIRNYFSFFFSQIVRGVADLEVLSQEELNSIFQEAREAVWTNWKSSLREACQRYPSLQGYIQQKKLEQLALEVTEETIPSPICGADAHFMDLMPGQSTAEQQNNRGHRYLEQSIYTPDGRNWLSARPDSDPLDWWEKLLTKLDEGPLFLTGPGGMGKTSFLCSLYYAVAQGKLETKFCCALLLSLDTMMREPMPELHLDTPLLADASKSVLFRRIALVTNTSGQERGWKEIFLQKHSTLFDRPVLLMLDGLNEMRGQAIQDKRRLYHRIRDEINCLSKFPNVRIVVTSRIDRENLLQSQLSALQRFQHMVLGGVNLPPELNNFLLEHKTALSPTMIELLKRPMYCWAVYDMLNDDPLPSTQFQLLERMYRRLCGQGEANIADQAQHPCLRYLMEYFVPILAYADWRGASLETELIQALYKDFLQWTPMIEHNTGAYEYDIKDQLGPMTQNPSLITKYLCETMQLLIWEDGNGSFCHQDYRDFLVAKYFFQRMEYAWQKPKSSLWKKEEVVNTLCLNTYSTSIMHLIYQAVSFSLPADEGEDSYFVQEFCRSNNWGKSGILAGHVLWYTTAYQLVDMRRLEDVSYGGKDLTTDALSVFAPLISYVQSEEASLGRTIHLSGRLLQNLIEILMKCCELFRSQKNYQKARDITAAARHILSYNIDTSFMGNVVDYNEAKVIFSAFLEYGTNDELSMALELLANSTTSHNAPFRFACNTLAMLLTSPHPQLQSNPLFLSFRQAYLKGRCPEVCAFWLYYNALFDPRKAGEDWQPRIYSLRQLLYLLSDHKVCVTGLTAAHLEYCSIQDIQNRYRSCIVQPQTDSCFLPVENILLIRRFLAEIRDVEGKSTQWKHYMQGLSALYSQPPDIASAKAELTKAGEQDVRAQMLLAFLDKDPEKLHLCYQRLRPKQHIYPEDIGKYCVWAYYDRDITKIYNDLRAATLPD